MIFHNKSVLVTGGTGSFGQKFIHTILTQHSPKELIVYSRDELKQYDMQQRFQSSRMRFVLGDVRSRDQLVKAMRGVDFVVHAAALKQIPTAEKNPAECIKTNIDGAQNVIDAAIASNVKKVIALSTDKAVQPVNLYGATKLASEKLFVAANNMVDVNQTQFSVVRYGNVVGTRGSVVPYFKHLIQKNAAVMPITDKRMTRFWISLDQGVNAVISAFKRMRGGEIFVPKIPSIKIVELAAAMAPTVPQKIIGIRPGEKVHELLCSADDAHLTYEFPDHYVITSAVLSHFQNYELQTNALGETGKKVSLDFEYGSNTNHHFLSIDDIIALHKQIDLTEKRDVETESCV